MTRTAAITALALASSLLAVSAQQPAQSPPSFRTGVDVVTMDVSVLDDNRRPVRGLTAGDFVITELGEPRPIVAFKAIDLPDVTRTGARWLQEVAPDVSTNTFTPDRIVVLLLDDVNVTANSANLVAVRKIGRAIVEQLGPADLGAVLYPLQTSRSVEFTADRAKLLAAVDRFTSFRPPDGQPSYCRHNTCSTAAMRAIAQATAAWPDRRKTIAYVSPEGRYQYGPVNIEMNAFEANSNAFDSVPDLMDTFRELQRANVNVYQFDPRGLEETGELADFMVGMFADSTGGRTVTRSNAPWLSTSDMFAENSSYYLLGFAPSGFSEKDGFRQVKVSVKGRDVTIRARGGYYSGVSNASSAARQPMSELDKAMTGAVPSADLPLTLTAAPFRVAGASRGAVAVVSGLDRRTDQTYEDNIEIAVRAYDARTSARESKGLWTSRLRVRSRSESSAVHFDTLNRLDLPPGEYEIRLAMKSSAAKLAGAVVTTVTVPDFDKSPLSLSGMVLAHGPGEKPASNDLMANVLPFRPTTVRTFGRSDSVDALVRVYQGGKDFPRQVKVAARIVDAIDGHAFDWTGILAPSDFDKATRAAEWRMTLPLRRLTAGDYLLSFEATLPERAPQARHVRFSVQ